MLNLFYRNPRLLGLTLAIVAVAGFAAYQVLPRQEDPRLTKRALLVTTLYPGADAEQVESLVTEKIEEELEEIEEIFRLTSSSRTGISVIGVEVSEYITPDEAKKAFSKVRNKVDDAEAQLPPGARKPVVNETDTEVDAYTIIAALVWIDEFVGSPEALADPNESGVAYAVLLRRAEALADRLRATAGTKQVELFGAPEEEIVAEVDAASLAQLNLSAPELARLIANSDAKVSAGQLRGRDADLLVEVEGEFDTLERIGGVPLLEGADGQILMLRDIATLKKKLADPPSELAVVSARPGVALGIRMEPGERVDRWAANVREAIAEESAALPRGVELELIFDQSRYVEERIGSLERNLFIGMALVMVVMLFTMGWRSALLVGSALPLTSLLVLALLRALGVPLHQMSITGMVIAIGLLIDTAIVMVDDVTWRLRQGHAPSDAVRGGVAHLAAPLAASTLTTVLAFMPIVLVPGSAGEFIGPIATSVILAVICSLAVALTITPAFTGLLNRSTTALERPTWWRQGLQNEWLDRSYGEALRWLFERPFRGVAAAMVLPLAGFLTFAQLEEQFFPPSDRDQFQIELRLPEQTPLARTMSVALEARRVLLASDEVRDVHWFAGSNAPKFYYNMLSRDDGSSFYAQALVQLRSREDYFRTIRELQDRLDESFPEAQFIARQLEQGPPFDAPVEVHLYGPDLDRLREIGERWRAELAGVPEVVHTRTTLSDGRPKLWLDTDEEQIRMAGLDSVSVAQQMQGLLEGSRAGSLIESTEELPVRVRIRQQHRGELARVASLDILPPATPGEAPAIVPLETLGTLRLVPELSNITHRDGRRSNTIQGFLTAGTLPSVVLQEYLERLESFELPPGYSWEVGGEASERNSAVGQLMASVGVLVILMISAIVLTFNSFRMAGIIAAVGMLAVGSGLTAIWLFDYPFGFVAIMGIMGLIGVSINDAIVVLAALRDRRPETVGEILSVVTRETRHVVSTTFTTIAGFLPLIVAGGGLWPPLVVAISGGVVGGTLLALVFVPSVYLLLTRPREVRAAAALKPAAVVTAILLLLALSAFGADQQSRVLPGTPAPDVVERLSLKEAVDLAVQRNPRLQIANLRVLESRGIYGQVRSGYLPHVNLQAQAVSQTANLGAIGFDFPGLTSRIGPYQNYDARPVVEQTILDLGLIRRMQAARERIRQSRWDAESLREATSLAVIQLYLSTLEADSRQDATAARLETARALLEQSKDFLEVGTASRLEYSRAEVQFQRETAALAAAEEALESSRLLLQQTIGIPVDGRIELTEQFGLNEYAPPPMADAIEQALESRPEMMALDAKLTSINRELQGARAQRLPTVAARADYGISATSFSQGLSTWSYGAQIQMPVFQGGRIGAEVSEVRAQQRQIEEERRELELQIQAEVRTALVQLKSAWTQAQAARQAVAAARDALDLSQARFAAGVTSNLDVVQAQESLASADNFEFETLYRYHLAQANYNRAVGNVADFL